MVHILLAEDNPGDVLLVQKALNAHSISHELHVVQDGAEALDFIARMGQPGQEPCPDVMLLDLNLPKVDGSEVLRRFRKRPECADIPVIVITSSNSSQDRARVAELGGDRYFTKPLDWVAFLQLGAVVREVIGDGSRHGRP